MCFRCVMSCFTLTADLIPILILILIGQFVPLIIFSKCYDSRMLATRELYGIIVIAS